MKRLIAIIPVLLTVLFLQVASARADGFWIYCDGTGTCWIATPSVTATVAPSPTSAPSAPVPSAAPTDAPVVIGNQTPAFACPGGTFASDGSCATGAAAGTATAPSVTAITTGDVNYRSGPGMDYPSYGVVPGGTVVTVTGTAVGIWLPVLVNGQPAWISSLYLSTR